MRLPGLEARLRGSLRRGMARRLVAWALVSAALWCLASALFLLLSPPAWATTGLALALLSLLPVFILWPQGGDALTRTLREADTDTVLEAWLGAKDGPARELLGRMARERDAALPWIPRKGPAGLGRLRPTRTGARLAGAALLSLALLELVALVVTRAPLLSYKGPRQVASSGLRVAEIQEPTMPGAEGEVATTPEEPRPEGGSGDSQALSTRKAAKDAELEKELLGPPTGERGEGGGGPGTKGGGATGAAKPSEAAGQAAPRSLSSGQPKGGEDGPGGAPRGQGYTGSASLLPRSPLVDYRAKILQALTEGGGEALSAGEGLDLGALRDYQRRYFSSFTLSSGSLPRDDAWAALVKRRWSETAGGGK